MYARAGSAANDYMPEGQTREALSGAVTAAQHEVDAAVSADDRAVWEQAVLSRREARQAVVAFDEASGPLVPTGELAVAPHVHEFGLRRCLGATSVQNAIQVLTETTLLGLLGGIIGASLGMCR